MTTAPRVLALGVGLVSTVIASIPAAVSAAAESVNRVVIEGMVRRGEEFARDFGSGFTFKLSGKDVWAIVITHTSSPDRDLVYPVNPPYRFSNRLYVGPGYGETARDSVGNTPRELAFIYRPDDVATAWSDLEKILWPYAHADVETERALDELARVSTGTVTFEILSADVGPDDNRPGADECVRWLKFRATLTWPSPSPGTCRRNSSPPPPYPLPIRGRGNRIPLSFPSTSGARGSVTSLFRSPPFRGEGFNALSPQGERAGGTGRDLIDES